MCKNLHKFKKWTEKELEKFKQYMLENKEMLLFTFYKNIIQGCNKTKKTLKFYHKLGQRLRRTANKCKSKFQKFEKTIYTNYLEVPKEHYKYYSEIKKKK